MERDIQLSRAAERDLLLDLDKERMKDRGEGKSEDAGLGRVVFRGVGGQEDRSRSPEERDAERDRRHQATLDKLMVSNLKLFFLYFFANVSMFFFCNDVGRSSVPRRIAASYARAARLA